MEPDGGIEIRPARSGADDPHVRELLDEYIEWDRGQTRGLGLDPDAMVAFFCPGDRRPHGSFAPPEGCLLLAFRGREAGGCGGFPRLADGACELKSLYVRPAFRGLGVGRALVNRLLVEAASAGYRSMRLETTTFMQGAQQLYRTVGFEVCEPYYAVPEMFRAITIFMQRALP